MPSILKRSALFALTAAGMALGSYVAHADENPAARICKAAEATPRPSPDSAGKAPKDCDALALYDGVGGKPDYRAARACALAGGDDILGSAAVLTMIFANGDGVARNDDLAIAYACDAGGAPAEISGRVNHLAERRSRGAQADKIRFDFCDDITSGMMEGACARRASRLKAAGRDAEIAKLTEKLPASARSAFATLRKEFASFKSALSENEVDLSGTARGAMMVEAEEDEDEAFRDTLRLVLSGHPAPAGKTIAEADAALNATYRKVQNESDESSWGTVTKDGIKTAQRAWLPYRDAFVAFAKAAGSKTPADALAARLTERRAESLASFVESPR